MAGKGLHSTTIDIFNYKFQNKKMMAPSRRFYLAEEEPYIYSTDFSISRDISPKIFSESPSDDNLGIVEFMSKLSGREGELRGMEAHILLSFFRNFQKFDNSPLPQIIQTH